MAYSEGSSTVSYVRCLVTGIYPEYGVCDENTMWAELDDIEELHQALGLGYWEIRVV